MIAPLSGWSTYLCTTGSASRSAAGLRAALRAGVMPWCCRHGSGLRLSHIRHGGAGGCDLGEPRCVVGAQALDGARIRLHGVPWVRAAPAC